MRFLVTKDGELLRSEVHPAYKPHVPFGEHGNVDEIMSQEDQDRVRAKITQAHNEQKPQFVNVKIWHKGSFVFRPHYIVPHQKEKELLLVYVSKPSE